MARDLNESTGPVNRAESKDELFEHRFLADPPPGKIWQDRGYFTIHGTDGRICNVGIARYRERGLRDGYVCVRREDRQHNVQVSGPDSVDWDGKVERLVVAGPDSDGIWNLQFDSDFGIGVDIEFTPRLPAILTQPFAVDKDGAPHSRTTNLFQSGIFKGTIEADGETWDVNDWLGHRDRSWGFRGTEGTPRAGFHFWLAAEWGDRALTFWTVETGRGRVLYLSGAMTEGDSITDVVAMAHDFRFDDLHQLINGEIEVMLADGRREKITVQRETTAYLSGVGYRDDGERHGEQEAQSKVTHEAWEINAEKIAEVSGLNDNVVSIGGSLGEGRALLEHSMGLHDKYRPG